MVDEKLRSATVDLQFLRHSKLVKTGVTIWHTQRGNRAGITYPGTIAMLAAEDLSDYVLQSTRVVAVFRKIRRCVAEVCEGQLDENGKAFRADVRFGSRGSLAQNLGDRLALLISQRLSLRARSEKLGCLAGPTRPMSRRRTGTKPAVRAACCPTRVRRAFGIIVTLRRRVGLANGVDLGEAPLEAVAFRERLLPAEWRDQDRAWVRAPLRDFASSLIGEIAPTARLIETT